MKPNQRTLQDLIRTQGGLAKTSEEGLKSLSEAVGRVAPPTNPLSAATIGANPDVAKMAGTKAQKQPAIAQSIEGDTGLRDALRQAQQPQAATAQQQAAVQKVSSLQGLSSLQDRVGELQQKMMQQAVPAAPQNMFRPELAENPEMADALTKLNTNPNDATAWLQATKASGSTTPITPEYLKSRYGSDVTKAITPSLREPTIADMSPEQLKSLGFGSTQDLAAALGVQGDIGNLTISQMVDKVGQVTREEYSRTQALQQMAADPYVGAAARAQARAELRQLGNAGMVAAEDEMDELADDLVNDLQVDFNGKTMSIKDALSSEEVDRFVTEYLSASPERKLQMRTDEPTLTGLIQKYDKVFADAAQELTKGQMAFADIQTKRAAVGDLGDGIRVSDRIIDKLFPGLKELGTEVPDLASASPLLASLGAADAPEKQSTIQFLDGVADINPEAFDVLNGASLTDLKRLGLDRAGPNRDLFMKNLKVSTAIRNTPDNPDPDTFARLFGFGDNADMDRQMKEARLMQASGLFGGKDSGLELLELSVKRNPDGSINPQASLANMKGALPPIALDKLAENAWTPPTDVVGRMGAYVSDNDSPIYDAVRSSLEDDLQVSADEYRNNIVPHLTMDNYQQFLPSAKTWTKEAQQAFGTDLANRAVNSRVSGKSMGELIRDLSLGTKGLSGEQVKKTQDLATNVMGDLQRAILASREQLGAGNPIEGNLQQVMRIVQQSLGGFQPQAAATPSGPIHRVSKPAVTVEPAAPSAEENKLKSDRETPTPVRLINDAAETIANAPKNIYKSIRNTLSGK